MKTNIMAIVGSLGTAKFQSVLLTHLKSNGLATYHVDSEDLCEGVSVGTINQAHEAMELTSLVT